MKKLVLSILSLFVCIIMASSSFASGFLQDADAIEKAAKSVLKLFVYQNADDAIYDFITTGSGFMAFNSSTLITNYHVIADAKKVRVAEFLRTWGTMKVPMIIVESIDWKLR